MDLETLKSARDTERQKDTHAPIDDDFYDEVREYLDGLDAAADDADSRDEESRLRDVLSEAEMVFESLIDRRQAKTIKQASLASTGFSSDEDGLIEGESALLSDLTDRLDAHRDEVLP